ncbi:MAG: response regulator, partial [Bacteroidota bacterium]|nr:response regulator [Bacteroidota bacterium]
TAAIFESFNQASSDITRKYGGTGLGLAITKRLLELQGSQINLKSQPGVGSKFYFSLKFKIGKRSIEETTSPAGTRPLFSSMAGIKILIVEDNPVNQFVAKKILSHWDIKTDTAKNGNLAVRKVKGDMYDLILMDLQMPEMDGYQATRIIKQMNGGKYKNIPVIALTASIFSDVQNKIYDAGMNDYISKPFNPKELYEKISKYAFLNPEKSKKENAKNAHGN